MKYYIIAGEASGDLHGSNLMKGIYAQDRKAQIRFYGGDLMNQACMDAGDNSDYSGLIKHYREDAIMGFWEILTHAKKLLGNVSRCKKDILANRPDVVILIDYPGFNFKIAEFAHKNGIRTFYYIAPKVWASREGRIRKLKKFVDKLFIVFPFEIEYFKSKGVDFVYRGNPLVDAVDGSVAMKQSREEFLKANGLQDRPIIGLMAGSRKGEISTMMPQLMEFARKMHQMEQYSRHLFLIAGAPARGMEDYEPYISDQMKGYVKVLFGQTQGIIKNSEAAVVNSGTCSLETALFGIPQVVGYRIGSSITYAIAKRIIKVKYISLGNLIVDKLAFKELIQDDCNPQALLEEVRALLEDKEYRQKMLDDYAEIRRRLGGTGASNAVAKAMTEELGV